MIYDVVVIGGGAAGLMAGGMAAKRGNTTLIVDKNKRPARKVRITGKGRCNITNNIDDMQELVKNVPQNGFFLYSAFASFMPVQTMEFFEKLGVEVKTERGNRVFPVSNKAADVANALIRFANDNGAKCLQDEVLDVCTEDDGFSVTTKTQKVFCKSLIIATGGLSYPLTGSTGDGYKFAKKLGHTVTNLTPSLVPLEVHEGWCSELQGLSLKNVSLTIVEKKTKKVVFEDFGEMLFTHYGISGPMVLSASAHLNDIESTQYSAIIDLKPALDEQKLSNRILRDFSENTNLDFINVLGNLLPRKLIPVITKLSGIPHNKKVNQITREERDKLLSLLKNLSMDITRPRPIDEAVITAGGVSVGEVDSSTMESKLCKGLYFVGEVLDVSAYTGGFNLQIAFSTANLAGSSV